VGQYLAVSRPDEFGGEVVTGHITNPNDNVDLFVVYNSGNGRSVNLPGGTWTQITNASGATSVPNLSGMATVDGSVVTVFSKAR
jgi:pullulanase